MRKEKDKEMLIHEKGRDMSTAAISRSLGSCTHSAEARPSSAASTPLVVLSSLFCGAQIHYMSTAALHSVDLLQAAFVLLSLARHIIAMSTYIYYERHKKVMSKLRQQKGRLLVCGHQFDRMSICECQFLCMQLYSNKEGMQAGAMCC